LRTLLPEQVGRAVELSLDCARAGLEQIYRLPEGAHDFENTALALDELHDQLDRVAGVVYLAAYTHPEEAVRKAARKSVQLLNQFGNELGLDERLYKALKAFATSPQGQALEGPRRKFVDESVREFERNGLALPPEQREELKRLKDRLSELGLAFSSNISEYQDSLELDEAELEGLPQDYKDERRLPDGRYRVDISYPSYRPFMRYARSGDARERLYRKFLNRAADKNPEVLDEIIRLRGQLAQMLGYRSFAEYKLENKMAKTPEQVWKFERELAQKLAPKVRADYQELLEIKRQHLGDDSQHAILNWESAFYANLLEERKYQVDAEQVKEYFELDNCLEGIFAVSGRLFGLRFRELPEPPVWHPEVRLFEAWRDEQKVGSFYLDLFPREGKYNHAAMFSVVNGRQTARGYQQPLAALVCNFPKPSAEKPSLLPHGEVETLFHEFGHLLHGLLTRAELQAQSGTSVARDYVETPSQLFENWAWEYESLRLFAKHYRTGEVLPKALYDKMLAAKKVGSGLHAIQQVFYGTLDMSLHDGFAPGQGERVSDVVRRLQNELTPYPYVEGTCFEAGFGHLQGYAAGYYGYLWALVYSEDIFSVFRRQGVFDADLGAALRDKILAAGSSRPEIEQVRDFLGREPSPEAFLEGLGI